MELNFDAVEEAARKCKGNQVIIDSFIKAADVLSKHTNIAVSISGGADSDIILDMVWRFQHPSVHYVWFDTGIEYDATKRHLKYLEEEYQIEIERIKPIKNIPECLKEYGLPFLSKHVSGQIRSLQRNNFQWEDEPFEVLVEKYPKCKSAIVWWCNHYPTLTKSIYNINYNKHLKQFLIENPPPFKVSSNCCTYTKKKVAKEYVKDHDIDLMVTGIRKSEGGIRSVHYTSCYMNGEVVAYDKYMPLFWYKNADRARYEDEYSIRHSDCYEVWGFKRTGCACCPYNREIDKDFQTVEQYEPGMAMVGEKFFGEVYEYTRKYREYAKIADQKR